MSTSQLVSEVVATADKAIGLLSKKKGVKAREFYIDTALNFVLNTDTEAARSYMANLGRVYKVAINEQKKEDNKTDMRKRLRAKLEAKKAK
jgi:hypothetical protein